MQTTVLAVPGDSLTFDEFEVDYEVTDSAIDCGPRAYAVYDDTPVTVSWLSISGTRTIELQTSNSADALLTPMPHPARLVMTLTQWPTTTGTKQFHV